MFVWDVPSTTPAVSLEWGTGGGEAAGSTQGWDHPSGDAEAPRAALVVVGGRCDSWCLLRALGVSPGQRDITPGWKEGDAALPHVPINLQNLLPCSTFKAQSLAGVRGG